jgi:hypothetical protein
MNNLVNNVRRHLDGFSFSDTVFKSDSNFLDSEVSLYSKEDRNNIWSPNGLPYLGEFDVYLKVYKNDSFQGFFRLEVYPWNEINLHIAFPTSNSFKSRYYLKTTFFFLSLLNDLLSQYKIYCLVDLQNRNVMRYMSFFNFERIGIENELIRYKFHRLKIREI